MQEATIDRITLIVSDLDRAEDDYVTLLGCEVERREAIEQSLTSVLGVPQASGQRSKLRLGRQKIDLLAFADAKGRPYPCDSTSTDIWFQHMAIVVSDVTSAHQRVMAHPRFRPISRTGPVRLPGESGGVTAFKFRDHDGHPLELIAFPGQSGPSEWRGTVSAGLFLGIDHTAIGVSDSAASTRFFGLAFGFRAGPTTDNRGSEQAQLDDVDNVHVTVTPLAQDRPAPRMELLEYHVGTRRPIRRDTASNDIAATHCVVQVASLDASADSLALCGMPLSRDDRMTLRGNVPAALVSGPDGHRFLLEERRPGASQQPAS